MTKISTVLITKNEEKVVARCLKSIVGFDIRTPPKFLMSTHGPSAGILDLNMHGEHIAKGSACP
jgi:hypothetical protein